MRVSLVCFGKEQGGQSARLDGRDVRRINPDLTAAVDLTHAGRLNENAGVAFMGDTKNGAFDIAGDLAREWLRLPANPNGRPNSDALKPWVNGMDLTRRPAGKWIIDFGSEMSETDAALYEAPFAYIAEHVRPVRQRNRARRVRDFWWRHEAPRPNMWQALGNGLSRYIATPTRRQAPVVCAGYEKARLPRPSATIVPSLATTTRRSASCTAGFTRHGRCGLAHGSVRGTIRAIRRPRPSRTYPFPEGLTPDVPARDYAQRSARRGHRRGRPAAGGAKGPLAEPARMGGVGGRARARLSEAPGRARRVRRQGAEETHAHEPLQRASAMARERPCRPRLSRRRGLWLAGGYLGRRCIVGISGAEFGTTRLADFA